jgi:hypothetical protein
MDEILRGRSRGGAALASPGPLATRGTTDLGRADKSASVHMRTALLHPSDEWFQRRPDAPYLEAQRRA